MATKSRIYQRLPFDPDRPDYVIKSWLWYNDKAQTYMFSAVLTKVDGQVEISPLTGKGRASTYFSPVVSRFSQKKFDSLFESLKTDSLAKETIDKCIADSEGVTL